MEPAHPFGAPGLVAPFGVLEETIRTNIGAPHEIRFAVKDSPARGRIEPEGPHAETGFDIVPVRADLQLVEERIFRRPKMTSFHVNRVNERLLLVPEQPRIDSLS